MRLLFATQRFHPSHGGVQTVVRLFSQALTELGHEVRVVTKQPHDRPDDFPFAVVRKPSARALVREFRRADAVVLHGASVSLGWPTLLVRTPVTAIHYMPEVTGPDRRRLNEFVRRAIFARCKHVSVSAGFVPDAPYPYVPAIMPIDTEFFRTLPGVDRDKDLFFIGRLVDIKGVDDLLDAVKLLNGRGRRYSLTVVGTGPEQDRLAARVRDEGLAGQVELTGRLDGDDLLRLMNRHKVVVVPSRYAEPFGLVAVEGVACGCVAVGTTGGGLPGAVGPCGVTVPNGDAGALADAVDRLLATPGALDPYRAAMPAHVAKHTPRAAAEHLLTIIAR